MEPEAWGPRVLFVDHTAALGGAELCLLDLAARAGGGSGAVLFEDGPFRLRLDSAGVPVQVLPAPAGLRGVRRDSTPNAVAAATGVASLAVRLARIARGHDVIYANTQKALVVAAFAGLIARRPVVWHLHDLLNDEHFGRSHRRAVVGIARRLAARVIANSEATRDAYIAAGGRPGHVDVVYNGIDPALFDAIDEEAVSRVRSELGANGAPLVGMFGRLAPWKGQLVLLEALAEIPDVRAIVVGEAVFESDRGFAEQVRRRIGELGLEDRVRRLGFRDDVPELMRACDVVVHASTSAEPFGRVIVEGMLAGRAVVATRAGGAVELVQDGTTGLLVSPGDAAVLREALGRLLGDQGLRERLGGAARKAARERFDPAAIGRQTAAVVRLVADRA